MSDHVAEARKHIEWAHDNQAEYGSYEFNARDNAMLAQAEALLAQAEAMRQLAEQQRIANMLTLITTTTPLSDGRVIHSTESFAMEARDRVVKALGLDDWNQS